MPSHPFDTPLLICYSYIQLHSGNEEKSTQRRHSKRASVGEKKHWDICRRWTPSQEGWIMKHPGDARYSARVSRLCRRTCEDPCSDAWVKLGGTTNLSSLEGWRIFFIDFSVFQASKGDPMPLFNGTLFQIDQKEMMRYAGLSPKVKEFPQDAIDSAIREALESFNK